MVHSKADRSLSVVYAILFMQFTSFPIVFQMYRHWSPGVSALAFIGIAVGSFMALAFIIFYENPRYARLHEEHGYLAPEVRLLGPTVGAICLPYVISNSLTPASASSSLHGPACPPPSTG